MLQETIYKRKRVGFIKRGFYYIETARAVWDRVQVVSVGRSRGCVRVLFLATERYRIRRGRYVYWKTRRYKRLEDIPLRFITVTREYINE